ncbi:MAG: TPM domain-containing protein [Nitrospirota bacterium]
MKLRIKSLVLIISIGFWFITAISFAKPIIPDRPLNHVVDLAGIINDNQEAGLNRYLLELEQKTTAQMIVLTITSLEGESIDLFSIETAEKWRLGQKGKDNGVLLLISLQDKKYRFEIGYGLEGILPDSLVGTIGRKFLVPYFRKGDYSTGIFTAALAVISEIATDAGVEIAGMPVVSRPVRSIRGRRSGLFDSIFSIIFFLVIIYLFIRYPRLFMFFLLFSVLGGGRRSSSWGGGGGFSGGSFGGGGGGGFGGGGASGGW